MAPAETHRNTHSYGNDTSKITARTPHGRLLHTGVRPPAENAIPDATVSGLSTSKVSGCEGAAGAATGAVPGSSIPIGGTTGTGRSFAAGGSGASRLNRGLFFTPWADRAN